jgi:hypothetical protein
MWGIVRRNLSVCCNRFTKSNKHCSICYFNAELDDKTDHLDYLNNVDYSKTIQFVPPITIGKVIKVYDGDTITIASKLPNNDLPIYRFSVRLRGIDSAEIKGKTIAEKQIAMHSRDELHKLIFGKIVHLKEIATEKYGRILADVYLEDLHINKWMLDNKLAVPYDGGTKIRPDEWNDK